MKGKSKKLILFVSLALVLSTALFGTLAYLTSEAKVTNTFTVGDVKLDLDEAKVNEKGEIVDKNGEPVVDADGNPVKDPDAVPEEDVVRTKDGNKYKLVPGKEYVKDPTVTVKAGSEDAYVRMLVIVNCADELDEIFDILRAAGAGNADLRSIFNGYDEKEWMYVGDTRSEDEDGKYITYEFRYKETVDGVVSVTDAAGNVTEKDEDVKLDALFDSFTLPGIINNDQLKALYDNDFEMVVVGQAIQAEGFADAKAAWAGFEQQMSVNAPADSDTTDSPDDNSNNGDSNGDNADSGNTGTDTGTTGGTPAGGTPAGGSSDGDE